MIRETFFATVALAMGFASSGQEYQALIYSVPLPLDEKVGSILREHLQIDPAELEVTPGNDGLIQSVYTTEWNGAELIRADAVWASGEPLVVRHEQKIQFGISEPYEYLEPRNDGRYDVKIGHIDIGLEVGLEQDGETAKVFYRVKGPYERAKVDGVRLDVGPMLEVEPLEWQFVRISATSSDWHCIPILGFRDPNPERMYLLFIRAREPGATNERTAEQVHDKQM